MDLEKIQSSLDPQRIFFLISGYRTSVVGTWDLEKKSVGTQPSPKIKNLISGYSPIMVHRHASLTLYMPSPWFCMSFYNRFIHLNLNDLTKMFDQDIIIWNLTNNISICLPTINKNTLINRVLFPPPFSFKKVKKNNLRSDFDEIWWTTFSYVQVNRGKI